MNWTEPKPPTLGVSYYDHVKLDTPLGLCLIEWKSWKDLDTYSVVIGDYYITSESTLDDAKSSAIKYLQAKCDELTTFLSTEN